MSVPNAALSLPRERLGQVRHGAVVVTTAPAVFRVQGPGALTCLQGLLTNDLATPGDQALVYGALLTPKGMIVVDYWVLHEGDAFTMVARREGHAASLDLFRRQLPPRLARVTDLTDQVHAAWVLGERGFQVLLKSGVPVPETAGRIGTVTTEAGPVSLALAPESAPFVVLVLGAEDAVAALAGRLTGAGATRGSDDDLRAAHVLAGWPSLGAEIDERTLPQEVRYDEIGGVSYTKGCYVGQETVARLHFRGHTNRELRGLRWRGGEPLENKTVTWREREVGTVRSTLALDDRILGLALIRREVPIDGEVLAGGRSASVVLLPFTAEDLEG